MTSIQGTIVRTPARSHNVLGYPVIHYSTVDLCIPRSSVSRLPDSVLYELNIVERAVLKNSKQTLYCKTEIITEI